MQLYHRLFTVAGDWAILIAGFIGGTASGSAYSKSLASRQRGKASRFILFGNPGSLPAALYERMALEFCSG